MTSITIVGAGILGLSCAWEIARRGGTVRVIEATAVGAGASGGHLGALAPHAPDGWNDKKAFQLDSLLAAPEFWAGVEQASGLPTGFGRTGRVQPLPDAATAERAQVRIAAAADRWPEGLGMRVTDQPGTPLAPVSPTGLWLHDGLTARLNPRAALAALAAAIRGRGGQVITGEPADIDGVTAPALWATGAAGLAALSADLGRPVGVPVKGQSALLHPAPGDEDLRDSPQVFADGLHVVPHADGTVAVGSTSEIAYEGLATDAGLDHVIARARALCPALANAAVIDRWAGLRPRARSRAPLLGAWPGRTGHLVVNGGFKIGFGMAPGIAALMADLVLAGQDRIPDGFRLG